MYFIIHSGRDKGWRADARRDWWWAGSTANKSNSAQISANVGARIRLVVTRNNCQEDSYGPGSDGKGEPSPEVIMPG